MYVAISIRTKVGEELLVDRDPRREAADTVSSSRWRSNLPSKVRHWPGAYNKEKKNHTHTRHNNSHAFS